MPFSSFSFPSLFTYKQIVWIKSAIVCCHNKNSLLETEHYGHKILMQWSSWGEHAFERNDSHAISCTISRQENGGLHKCIARFITYSSPWRAVTWFPSLPRKECTGVRYVITKFSYPWCFAGALRAPELRYNARPSGTLNLKSLDFRPQLLTSVKR